MTTDQLRCRCGHREGTHERGGHGRCDVTFMINDGDRITRWRCDCETFKNKKEPS